MGRQQQERQQTRQPKPQIEQQARIGQDNKPYHQHRLILAVHHAGHGQAEQQQVGPVGPLQETSVIQEEQRRKQQQGHVGRGDKTQGGNHHQRSGNDEKRQHRVVTLFQPALLQQPPHQPQRQRLSQHRHQPYPEGTRRQQTAQKSKQRYHGRVVEIPPIQVLPPQGIISLIVGNPGESSLKQVDHDPSGQQPTKQTPCR